MKKTDVVFYLSLIAGLGTVFLKLSTGLVSNTVATWIAVVCGLVQFVAFAFYERINGTLPPPTPPTTPTV